jgi:galactosylceramidase
MNPRLLVLVLISLAVASSQTSINLDGSALSWTYDGHGALSAGASSRLLIDYAEPMRSDILDLLFKPNYGAAMHMIKVCANNCAGDT